MKLNLSVIESLATDAKALIDWLNLHLTANQLSSATKNLIQQSLEANPVTSASSTNAKYDRLYAAILLVAASPEYLIQK